jgi:hypothetical protein
MFGNVSKVAPDTKALRQVVVTGLLAFVVGAAGVFAWLAWLVWRFVVPESPWYDTVHASLYVILFTAIGGLAFAAGAVNLLSWWQYRRGLHRCEYCDRPLRGIGVPCDCPQSQALRAQPR